MAGQVDHNPEIVDGVAVAAAEAFFRPDKPDGLVPLEFWQLGSTEQARWRRVATRVLNYLRAEKDRRMAQTPASPVGGAASPLFARGAAR